MEYTSLQYGPWPHIEQLGHFRESLVTDVYVTIESHAEQLHLCPDQIRRLLQSSSVSNGRQAGNESINIYTQWKLIASSSHTCNDIRSCMRNCCSNIPLNGCGINAGLLLHSTWKHLFKQFLQTSSETFSAEISLVFEKAGKIFAPRCKRIYRLQSHHQIGRSCDPETMHNIFPKSIPLPFWHIEWRILTDFKAQHSEIAMNALNAMLMFLGLRMVSPWTPFLHSVSV